MINIRKIDGGVVIPVRVQPNASKERAMGEYAEKLKIAVTAPPEKGKANKAIVKALAKWLNIKISDIRIISGEKSQDKEIFVKDITDENIQTLL